MLKPERHPPFALLTDPVENLSTVSRHEKRMQRPHDRLACRHHRKYNSGTYDVMVTGPFVLFVCFYSFRRAPAAFQRGGRKKILARRQMEITREITIVSARRHDRKYNSGTYDVMVTGLFVLFVFF